MISIYVGGNRPGPSPCFPEYVDAQARGVDILYSGGKQEVT